MHAENTTSEFRRDSGYPPEGTEEVDSGGELARLLSQLAPRVIRRRRLHRPDSTPAGGPDPYGDADPAWLETDWREHMRSVDVLDTRVNYVELGSGPPIVFVHGLAGCWQNWLANLPRVAADGFRAIAIDLPGFGASPMPPWPIAITSYAGLVDELCRALNLHAVTLVGNSMGGFICAEVAIQRPDWVERLVLVSAAGISHSKMRRHPAEISAPLGAPLAPLFLRLREASLERSKLRRLAFGNVFHHPHLMPRELLWEFWQGGTGVPGFMPAVRALVRYDFLDRLDRISVPTLIVWGRDDLIVPASDAPGYHERIPDSELVVFAECGHVPMAERPVRFNRLLAEFAREG